jgi:hypothetical protein
MSVRHIRLNTQLQRFRTFTSGAPVTASLPRSIQFPRFPPFYILWLGYGIRVEFSPEATTSQLCLPVEEGECK